MGSTRIWISFLLLAIFSLFATGRLSVAEDEAAGESSSATAPAEGDIAADTDSEADGEQPDAAEPSEEIKGEPAGEDSPAESETPSQPVRSMAGFFNWCFSPWLGDYWGDLVAHLLTAFIKWFLLIQVVAVGALVFIWAERKVSGRIQDRLGPTRVGGKFGWLQGLADGIKLITKEDVMPGEADAFLFRIAPYISLAASATAFLALPFADGWVAQHINVAVFFILAVLGLEVFGVILAGYGSGSKWSLFGGMREAAQVVSYEVPLGLCVVVPVMICGTMNLVTIGNMQAGWFTNWLVFHDPFTFIIFWVYFTCGTASVNRAPFDLAEAESELVAGFHTEYSGIRWSIFFMAEYGSMIMVGALATTLFFGGWHGPIPIFSMLGGAEWEGAWGWAFYFISNLFGLLNFLIKTSIGVVAMIWVRWTLPRLRIDQVITTCLKYCVPIAAFCFIGVIFWQTAWPWLTPNRVIRGEVREHWVEAEQDKTDDEGPGRVATSDRMTSGGVR